MEYKIELKNKNKEIVDYTIVSKDYFNILNTFKWHLNTHGYIQGKVNGENFQLHRYIYKILNTNIDKKLIDHIDKNPLNNTIENLRVVTYSENNHNRTVSENTSSIYLGVCWSKRDKIWRVQKKINKDLILTCSFKNEKHAAHQYDLWCKEYNILTASLNNINQNDLKDFNCYIKNIKNTDDDNITLPKGIVFFDNKYIIKYNNKNYSLNTLEEANHILILKNKQKDDLNILNETKRINTPIKRNKDNIAIIEIGNNENVLIDDKYYYEITKYKWRKSKNYITGDINKKTQFLHRFIYESLLNKNIDDKIIDHINNNPLDNRTSNLRIATKSDNAHNRNKLVNCSSNYIGVSFDKKRNKWFSQINNNKKHYNLGRFDTELEALLIRDKFVIKNKLTSKLNIDILLEQIDQDYCKMVKKCYTQVIDCIVDENNDSIDNISQSIEIYKRYMDRIDNYQIDFDDLIVSAMLAKSYKTRPVHVQLAEKLKARKEEVQIGDRIQYMYIENTSNEIKKKSELGEDPIYAKKNGLKYNRGCYLSQLAKPLVGFFKVILVNHQELLEDLIESTNIKLIEYGEPKLKPSDYILPGSKDEEVDE